MENLTSSAALRFRDGARSGKSVEIRGILRIGRHPYNDVSLPDLYASRYHCWITQNDMGYYIEDLASSNGTHVNDRQVMGRRRLNFGDVVRVGMTRMVFAEAAAVERAQPLAVAA